MPKKPKLFKINGGFEDLVKSIFTKQISATQIVNKVRNNYNDILQVDVTKKTNVKKQK